MTRSFYGLEDLGLSDRLRTEMPSILNWALAGRDRLYARGHFLQPRSANQMVKEFNDLGSPEAAFLRDRCDHEGEVPQPVLFQAWCRWCDAHGQKFTGTSQTFGRNVRAVLPWIEDGQRGSGKAKVRVWKGLRLKDAESSNPPTESRLAFDKPPAYLNDVPPPEDDEEEAA
jgi:putative DNA primase/helicase